MVCLQAKVPTHSLNPLPGFPANVNGKYAAIAPFTLPGKAIYAHHIMQSCLYAATFEMQPFKGGVCIVRGKG